jgi:hypothetical protein
MKAFRFLSSLIVIVVATTLCLGAAEADDPSASSPPWARKCKNFDNSRQFVNEATLFCIKNASIKDCQQQAAQFFQACHYRGDFKKMSAKAQARMLVVLALAGGATLRRGESM